MATNLRSRIVLLLVTIVALGLPGHGQTRSTTSPSSSITYQVPLMRSAIPVPTPPIVPNPRSPSGGAQTYYGSRGYAYADFNGDGLVDMFVAPSFGQNLPYLPVEIWLNKGDNTFRNGTAETIDGAAPLTGAATEILIGDFNEDGRPDVFIIDSGMEHFVADHYPEQGFHNTLMLSLPNGKLKDATSQVTPNVRGFNHKGGMGDFNGDGHLDLVVNRGATDFVDSQGVVLLKGDGHGNFVETIEGLSQDIAYLPLTPGVRRSNDVQNVGCAALGDLDGDGRADLITGTYAMPDPPSNLPNPNAQYTRNVRFYQSKPDGSFVERNRVLIPQAIAGVGVSTPSIGTDGAGLGAAPIVVGDLNGDGRPEVVVNYEGYRSHAVIWRNDGNFQFTDMTLAALGTYQTGFTNSAGTVNGGEYTLVDVNGDGALDLVTKLAWIEHDFGLSHVVSLNDGAGHFTPWVPQGPQGPLTPAELLSASQCPKCLLQPYVFPTNRSGLPGLVLLDWQSSRIDVGTPPYQQTSTVYLTTFAPIAPPRLPPPANLTFVVSGNTVTLTWPGVPGAASYDLEAGSRSGMADLAVLNTTAFGYAATAGTGTYYVRVRAKDAAGITGPPSNQVIVRIDTTGCSVAPGAPTALSIVSVTGGTVVLVWTAPAGPVTSYIVEAGSVPGGSDLANSDLGTAMTSLTATGVGQGIYYVRFRAKNACGVGPVSNEIIVNVP